MEMVKHNNVFLPTVLGLHYTMSLNLEQFHRRTPYLKFLPSPSLWILCFWISEDGKWNTFQAGVPYLVGFLGNFFSPWANIFGFIIMFIFVHMPKSFLVCFCKSNKYLMKTKFVKITQKMLFSTFKKYCFN